MARTREADELEFEAATTTRHRIGAPRVQSTPAACTVPKPTAAEIKARQDAIRETRRPTKPIEPASAVRAERSAGRISVPDVEPSECEERDE